MLSCCWFVYKTDSYGSDCKYSIAKNIKISKEDQETIVNKHNELRRKVAKGEETRGEPGPQPSASNMRELVRFTNYLSFFMYPNI